MNTQVKEFLEKNIQLLEDDKWDYFLYQAYFYVDDTGKLIQVLEDAGIECKQHLQSAIEYHMQRDDTFSSTSKSKLSFWMNIYPNYGLHGTEWYDTFVSAMKNVYPNKIISVDNNGIEYIVSTAKRKIL